jgi:hypothetical protein
MVLSPVNSHTPSIIPFTFILPAVYYTIVQCTFPKLKRRGRSHEKERGKERRDMA